MSPRPRPRTPALALATALLALAAVAPAGAAVVEETIDRTLPFAPGDRLVLGNTNGGVEISAWDRDEIEIHAVKRSRAALSSKGRDALDDVTIDIREESDGVRIETRRPSTASSFLSWMFGGGSVSVSYAIRLPREADVEVTTVNGSVTLAGVDGRHELSSTNGRIDLRDARGSVRATTTNGGIDAELAEVAGDRPIRLSTTNGAIRVALPATLAAELSARTTNGSITTDFPVRVEGRLSRRSLTGTINGGGPEIELRTTNGSIRVSEL